MAKSAYDILREQMKKEGITGGNMGGVTTKPYTPPAQTTVQQPVNTAPSTSSYTAPSENPYTAYFRRMESAARQQERERERLLDQQYQSGVSDIRKSEADLLRQAEINARIQTAQFPQQAALLGGGGASESALIDQQARLGEARTDISKQALSEIGGLRGKLQAGQAANTEAYQSRMMDILSQEAKTQADMQQKAMELSAKAQTSGAKSKLTSTTYKTDPDFADDYALVANGNVSRFDLLQGSADLIRRYGVDGYRALLSLTEPKPSERNTYTVG